MTDNRTTKRRKIVTHKRMGALTGLILSLILCFTVFSNVKVVNGYGDSTNTDEYAPVFNATYYANKYPDLKATYGTNESALRNHFINNGMNEGRQGSEEFNVYAYKARYADLRAVYGDDLKKYYLHYINSGKAEGRNGRADGSTVVTNPTTPVNPSTPTSAKYTAPLYPLYTNDTGWGSWLTVKAGQSNGYWTAKQTDIDKANYNPYGKTEGYSVLTGYAKIGDIRYLNFSNTAVHLKMNNLPQISYKMECYAINKNGVPLFRQVGSNYNVYKRGTNLVPFIDSITPNMTVYDVQALLYTLPYAGSCTAAANQTSSVLGQLLIENYHLVSDVINHEQTHIYIGNGQFLQGRNCEVVTIETAYFGRGSAGTFYVDHYSVK